MGGTGPDVLHPPNHATTFTIRFGLSKTKKSQRSGLLEWVEQDRIVFIRRTMRPFRHY
jgi:hypothetical protein